MSREIIVTRYEKSTAFLDRQQVINLLANDKETASYYDRLPDKKLAKALEDRFYTGDFDFTEELIHVMDKQADYDDEWDFLGRPERRAQ